MKLTALLLCLLWAPVQAGELLGQDKLCGVALPLVKTIKAAAPYLPFDIKIISGTRTLDRQRQLVAMGVSWTLNSRHLYGLAVDIAPVIDGRVVWDWAYFNTIGSVVMKKAEQLQHPVEWGGDWKSTPDGPHFQLSKKEYPDGKIHYTTLHCKGR